MRSIAYYSLKFIGFLFSFLFPYENKNVWVAIRRRLYTGYISSHFEHIGRFSLIDIGAQVTGRILLGSNSCIDKHCSITSISSGSKSRYISIGDNVSIGPYAHITSITNIIIGNDIDIGPHCLISDNSKKASPQTVHIHPRKRPLTTKGPIEIGDYTWIGENVCIMSGVRIGSGCVIGANSVVTHSIPDRSVAVGVPAKIISKIE